MGVKLISSDESSSTLLGDWYANDLVIDRKQYIFCVSQNGRLFVLLKAAPYKDFHTRISEALSPLLQSLGIERDKVSHETSQMSPITLAKTADRSIVSTMNEYKYELEIWGKMGRFDITICYQLL